MKYLVGHYYNGSFGTGTTGPYKVYKARNKHDAERMYQYEFGGYSDNHDVYFKFREYKICLSKSKDNIWLSKNGSKLIEGTWQEVKILEQIGKIFVGDARKVG